MVIMVSRSTVFRFLSALVLLFFLAGCGVPLSEHWSGYRPGQGAEPSTAADSPAAAAKPPAPAAPDCRRVKCVALTFDDGPGAYTEAMLKLLDEHNAKATFFLIGKNVERHPGIARDEVAAGHEIGNHTFSHQDLTKLSLAAGQRELRKTEEAIKKATGATPTLVRPPYGVIPKGLKKSLDVPVALWSVDTLDWKTRDTKKTTQAAEKIAPGSIVLMHDIHKSTLEAMPKILTDLGAQGYHFVTVSQLVGNPKPGIAYGTGLHPGGKG